MITLTPEQLEDAERMSSEGDFLNFSLPGTGKTLTSLRAIKNLTKNSHSPTRGLVVAPVIALEMWRKEISSFLGADAKVLKTGDTPLGADFHICSFDMARNRHAELYDYYKGDVGVNVNIIDESHNIRNPEAGMTQALFGKKCTSMLLNGGLVERFDVSWNLTGTPIWNYANDMFTQVALLHPDYFQGITSYDKFIRTYCFQRRVQHHPRMAPRWEVKGNVNELGLKNIVYKRIGAIRRRTIEGMPEVVHNPIELVVKLNNTYKPLTKMDAKQIIDMLNDPESLVSKARRVVGLIKVEQITEHHLVPVAKDQPVLVGCWHHDVMDEYQKALKKTGVTAVQVRGDTPNDKREEIRRRFNAGDLPVLLGQMQTMGTAWNLQEACRRVVIAEEVPVPGIVEQFYKRVARKGQKHTVQVDYLTSKSNIDAALRHVRIRKETSQEKING